MRDFYPEDMAVRRAIFQAWESASREHGFLQYDACVVESLELLRRKGGEEISEQIYTFKDKSDRDLALRAEMTPSLARMIVARQGALSFPLKWFAIAQCFRYERMTQGRRREHYQWNLDVVGEESVSAEAEVLATALRALDRLGLPREAVAIRVSSRALLADLLARSGIPPALHPATFLALDKRGKRPDDEIRLMLRQEGLDEPTVDAVLDLSRLASLDDAVRFLGGPTPASTELAALMDLAAAYGIADRLVFDISVVRGLGYYTGAVFEAFDRERRFRALFGGGRYGRLLADLGGKPMPAVGLGFGDVVLSELLADQNRLPVAPGDFDVAIGYMEDAQRPAAVRLACRLRASGRSVDMALRSQKAKAFFSRVGQGRCREAIFLGPDDIARGEARAKNLQDRTERAVPLS